MKFNKKALVVALAAALPWIGAQAQSNADLLRQIEALKAQLEALTAKVEAVSKQAGGVNPQEFNRLVQKVDLVEENSIASGFKGLKFKGVIEAAYIRDRLQLDAAGAARETQRFSTGNGNFGTGMFEISKEVDDGVSWLLRLTPGLGKDNIVHEANVSIPIGNSGTKLNAGLTQDYQGYEYSFAHQNPLLTHNLLWGYAGPAAYEGVGMSYAMGKLAAKWMFGNIDGQKSGKAPGIAYRADYTVSEFTYVGFAGVHSRTTRQYDLIEVDAGFNRGDWVLNGQLNYGRERGAAFNGGEARWWGASALAGYKITPTLQFLTRFDYISNRRNGGGIYVEGPGFGALGVGNTTSGFGPELDNTGAVIDPNRGANRYALSVGVNYAINANAAWKTEVRMDRSSGFNFLDPKTGLFKRSNVLVGTGIVVSF
ncbi:MAG: DUF3138 family protein [Rhodoferax sp.]|nr:DUF3138 family protein [Rhodoferax sp.]